MAKEGKDNNSEIIFVGLDLGTSQSGVATSTGLKYNVPSVVGWPKDFISYNVVDKHIVFGDECLKNQKALDLVFPLEKGVIKYRGSDDGSENREAIAANELLNHLLSLVEKKNKEQKVYAVVGAPARAKVADKQAIIKAADGLIDSILVVSEPFLVAYNLGQLEFSMVVDIGAGTLDICRMTGTVPEESDQATLTVAGDEIDQTFYKLLKDKHPGIHLTHSLARHIKEEFSFVGEGSGKVNIDFFVDGKPTTIDVSGELKEACSIIVPEITKHLRNLIVTYDPEYVKNLCSNIVLTGGGCKIRGLADVIEHDLSDLGTIDVTAVDDPFFHGALGGLKLAQEIPYDEWK